MHDERELARRTFVDEDFLDQRADDLLLQLDRTGRVMPRVSEVLAERDDRAPGVRREGRAVVVEGRDLRAEAVECREGLVPPAFELDGDEAVASVDRVVLFGGARRVVLELLDLPLHGQTLVVLGRLYPVEGGQARLDPERGHHAQDFVRDAPVGRRAPERHAVAAAWPVTSNAPGRRRTPTRD